jgi:hypothetical protein
MRHILYVCFALFMGALGLNAQSTIAGRSGYSWIQR